MLHEKYYILGAATMKVLVTGGAGYIGSITATALEEYGHTPIILDSLLTGPRAFIRDRVLSRRHRRTGINPKDY
jgi:UDP-glucose 4-epimerase